MSTKRFNIGDEVHWTDPDEGACSGNGVIAECWWESEEPLAAAYLIQKNDGGEVEAFEHEIREAEGTEVEA